MEVIEYMKEDILCLFFTSEIMNIIHNDYIHRLIEVHEIVNIAVLQGVYKLLAKLLAGYIDNQFIREILFYLVTDGLHKVRLPQTHSSINHQGFKGSTYRFLSNCISRRTRQPIAINLNTVIEGVVLI